MLAPNLIALGNELQFVIKAPAFMAKVHKILMFWGEKW